MNKTSLKMAKAKLSKKRYPLVERVTVFLIPYLVLLLTVFFVLDNPFWTVVDLSSYETGLTIFDGVIVFFFALDLVFKWRHIHNLQKFVKLYWIDIIATFPIYLLIRTYSELVSIFRIGEEVSRTAETLGHEAVVLHDSELLKEGKLMKEAALLKETSFLRSMRFLQRLFRMLKARLFFTHKVLHQVSKDQMLPEQNSSY